MPSCFVCSHSSVIHTVPIQAGNVPLCATCVEAYAEGDLPPGLLDPLESPCPSCLNGVMRPLNHMGLEYNRKGDRVRPIRGNIFIRTCTTCDCMEVTQETQRSIARYATIVGAKAYMERRRRAVSLERLAQILDGSATLRAKQQLNTHTQIDQTLVRMDVTVRREVPFGEHRLAFIAGENTGIAIATPEDAALDIQSLASAWLTRAPLKNLLIALPNPISIDKTWRVGTAAVRTVVVPDYRKRATLSIHPMYEESFKHEH